MKYTRKSRALAAKSRAVQAQIQCIQMCFSSHFSYDSSYLNGIARKGMPLLYDEEASQAAPCIVGALGLRGRRHPLRSPWPLPLQFSVHYVATKDGGLYTVFGHLFLGGIQDIFAQDDGVA